MNYTWLCWHCELVLFLFRHSTIKHGKCSLYFVFYQGWTIFEILRYAPQHNWSAYEEALKTNPVFAKMVISGVVYSLGDWIAQVSWAINDILDLSCGS